MRPAPCGGRRLISAAAALACLVAATAVAQPVVTATAAVDRPARTCVGVRLSQPLGSRHLPGLDVTLVVRNALDREYRDFPWSDKPFAPSPGRDVRSTATWRF